MCEHSWLTVNLFPHTHAPYLEEQELEGEVLSREGSCFLNADTGLGAPPVELELTFPRKMESLMRYFAEHSIRLKLEGDRHGDLMKIHTVSEAGKETFQNRMSAEQIEWMASCLEGRFDPKKRYLIRRADDAKIWLEVMGDRAPEWVRRAIRKNMQLQKGGGNTDSRGHALQALNYLCSINWAPEKPRLPSVQEAERILDREFFGLKEAKTRILEMVAQMNRTGKMPKWGLLLNGPAGVGKSSILKALARILGMPIIQLDISSVGKDVEAISGSSRIFSNAYGGKILSGMYQRGTSQAIVVINELDKCGSSDARIADVLLTLVDKLGFYENFLEETIPTGNMFFVASSNEIDRISEPMKNRFLTVQLSGYSVKEKEEIFRRFVMPAAMREMNISAQELEVDSDAVSVLVSEYALEPGVRDLEQYAQTITGDFARSAVIGGPAGKRIYREADLRRLFGPGRKIVSLSALRPGTVTGAYYHDGKAHFFEVQASLTRGAGNCLVYGPLTELQRQFAQVAFECVRNTSSFELNEVDVSIFVRHPIPTGFDNPLGMAVFAAVCSMCSGRAMDLGNLLFVGGCDLYGNLYFEEWDLMPLLKAMTDRGISTLYAPPGTGRLMEQIHSFEGRITVIEAPDAMTLFSLAMAQSRKAG